MWTIVSWGTVVVLAYLLVAGIIVLLAYGQWAVGRDAALCETDLLVAEVGQAHAWASYDPQDWPAEGELDLFEHFHEQTQWHQAHPREQRGTGWPAETQAQLAAATTGETSDGR